MGSAGVEEQHEVVRHENQADVVDHTPNDHKGGDCLLAVMNIITDHPPVEDTAHTVELDAQRAPAETHEVGTPDLEQDLEPHGGRMSEGDARPVVNIAVHSRESHAQQNDEGEHGDGSPHHTALDDDDQPVDQGVIDALAQVDKIQAPGSPANETGQDDPAGELGVDGDLYNDDEYADEYTDLDNTSGNASEQRGELVLLADKDYDEYEEVEEANDFAPEAGAANGRLIERPVEQDDDSEKYYDEYDDTAGEGKPLTLSKFFSSSDANSMDR
ncbi:hypothetical protein FRC12_002628 [Ceratobasidium sp. 428]|nr:hypothetical protein FRC12_002628 [Ceratobasidium sp. 428]